MFTDAYRSRREMVIMVMVIHKPQCVSIEMTTIITNIITHHHTSSHTITNIITKSSHAITTPITTIHTTPLPHTITSITGSGIGRI